MLDPVAVFACVKVLCQDVGGFQGRARVHGALCSWQSSEFSTAGNC
jgi:hypothetical protein